MKKVSLLLALFTALMLVAVAIPASAAEAVTVYVNAGTGSDSAAGTASAPLKTIDAAAKLANGKDVTVVLTADYTVANHYDEPAHTGKITYTASDGAKDYGTQLVFNGSVKALAFNCNGPVTFENITLKMTNYVIVAGQYNPLTFGEGVKCVNGSSFLFALGGYEKAPTTATLNADSHLTINSGEFYKTSGFNRAKGDTANTSYTGVAYITVNGGRINNLYGASIDYYYSGGAVITVNGGSVGTLATGGGASRRLDRLVELNLNGGTVGVLTINNATAGARVTLAGATVKTVSKSFYNVSLEQIAEKAGATFNLTYNSLFYTAAQVETFASVFDTVENFAAVYVKAGATGNGFSESAPTGSFAGAVKLLETAGGRIVLLDAVSCDAAAVKAGGAITVTGGELKLSGTVKAESALVFENTALSGGTLTATADLTVGEGVTVKNTAVTVENAATTILSGDFASVTAKNATVEAVGGNLGSVTVTAEREKTACVTVEKATVGTLTLSGAGELKLGLYGGKVAKLDVTADGTLAALLGTCDATVGTVRAANATAYVNSAANAALVSAFVNAGATRIDTDFYYVAGGVTGDGTAPHSPLSSLSAALKKGGDMTVVVVGNTDLNSVTFTRKNKTVLTSADPIHDYRADGVRVTVLGNPTFAGDTEINAIVFETAGSRIFYAKGYRFVIGEGVSTELVDGNTTYISIVGGGTSSSATAKSDVTVNSGDWNVLRGGNDYTGGAVKDTDFCTAINGGTFHSYVVFGSRGTATGKVTGVINGGVFYQGVYGLYEETTASYSINATVSITINGGTVYGAIGPAKSAKTKLDGSYTLTLNGGDYGHITDIWGSERYEGSMTSEIRYGAILDEMAKITGESSFTNPIRKGADPHLFYYDNNYYLICTAGSSLSIIKAANLGDMLTSASFKIITPAYGENLWSPEIHYFSEEEVGAANAGWYIYFSFNDGVAVSTHRQHVLKCKDGDDLLGDWVNPVTGKVNEPYKVEFRDAPAFNNEELCGGTSVIRINGKTYITFVTERGRGSEDFHQEIYIIDFENPWTYIGQPTLLIKPEYSWEMGGYGKSSNPTEEGGGWYPKVVEGAAAVYGDNGEVYLMYTGSGYWTIYYQLGFIQYIGGDPLNAASWKRNPNPVFSLSSEVNGCGHGSYTVDMFGTKWIAYHGYLGKDTQSKRYVFFEPFTVTDTTVKIGDASGHPASLSTVYTVPLNPTPIAERVSGFTSTKKLTKDDPIVTAPVTTPVTTTPTATGEPTSPVTTDGSAVTTGATSADTGSFPTAIVAALAAATVIAVAVLLLLRKKKA